MSKGVFGEIEKYGDAIEFLASGSKDIKDVSEYLISKDIPDSTIRGHMKEIKDHKSVLLDYKEPSTVTLNRLELEKAIEWLCRLLKVEKTSLMATGVAAAFTNLRTTSGDKNAQIEALKKQVNKLQAIISEKDVLLKEKQDEVDLLSQELKEAQRKELELPTVLVSTEEILPKATAWERQLVISRNSEEQDDSKKEDEKKPAVTAKNEDGFIFTFRNYVKRGIQGILTKSFMTERIKLLLQNQGMSEFVSDKQYVNNLLAEPSFTNQQKLALYAAFSDYRHTDFERLLNFAGDNDVDANLLIQWVESLGDEQDFKQIKNALRQFAKPTEYKLKYELAWELLLGYWQVEFYKDGVPTRFRLIAESDIEKIREKLGLSESAFTYHDYVTYENVSDKKEEKEETMVKKKIQDKLQENKQIEAPKFIQRYFMKDNDIFPDDYDLPEESINYGEFENDERG